ncbi:MAG: hypothetical protein ACREN3_04930 [Gemmatimonadaceae bacterium]
MHTVVVKGPPRPPSVASALIASRLQRLALATLLLAGASCGDSTAPKSMTVAVSVLSVGGPDVSTIGDSVPLVTCGINLSATAAGTDTATWQDGKVRWYAGVDRSTPFDSLTMTAVDVRQTWGNKQIGAGQTQTSHWEFQATAPFHADIEYHYQPAHGDEKTADAGFDCGPKMSPDTPAPSIDSIAVPGDPTSIEAGDTLTVDYTATSPVGILQTAVVLSGACSVHATFPEQLQTKLPRSARLLIPADCQLGVPLFVTVYATGAGLQTSSRSLSTPLMVVDHTPPYLHALFSPTPPILFDGDSIMMHVEASDNRALAAVLWDVAPAGTGGRDSLVVTGQSVTQDVVVHLTPGTIGPVQLRLYARDAVGNVDTLTTPWQVYPTVHLPIVSATADGSTDDAIPDPRRQLAYLLQPESDPSRSARILVMSLSTGAITQTISVPGRPNDFDITPGGDSLIVGLDLVGALGVIELRQSPLTVSLLPLVPVDSASMPRPLYVRTLSNGKVFASLFRPYLVDEIDLKTGVQRIRSDAGSVYNACCYDAQTAPLGRSLDHSVVVVNGSDQNFQRYDVSTDAFGPRRSATIEESEPALDSTGRFVAVQTTVYDDALQLLRVAAAPLDAVTALSPDGETLYAMTSYGIVRARVSDGSILDRITGPIGAVHHVRISDDGSLLTVVGGVAGTSASVIRLH